MTIAMTPAPKPPAVYYALHLAPGEGWVEGDAVRKQPSYREHVAYMAFLHEDGRLVWGGPYLDTDGALYVLKDMRREEAERIAEKDPMVKAGVCVASISAWMCPLHP